MSGAQSGNWPEAGSMRKQHARMPSDGAEHEVKLGSESGALGQLFSTICHVLQDGREHAHSQSFAY